MLFRRLFLVAVLCTCAVRALAQYANDNITDSIHRIDEVRIERKRVDRSVSASTPLQTVDKEVMQQLGMTNLSDAVKRFAGVNVRDYGGIGGMKTVSVHNLGAHHTAVSYDGLTVSNTQAGQIDVGRFSLDNVQNVTLAIGADDQLMQSARHFASAGIISIQTERPVFEDDSKYALRFRLNDGSFGMVNPSLRYWQKMGQQTALALNGNYMRADGTYKYTLVNGRYKTEEKRYNTEIYTLNGEANLYHTFGDGSQLDAKAYWFHSHRGLPGAVTLYNPVSNERLHDEDFFTQMLYRKAFNDQWQVHARLKYTHSWTRYEDSGAKYQGGHQEDIDRQDEYYGSVTAGWTPTRNFGISLAQDMVFNNLRSNICVGSNSQPANPNRVTSLTALMAKWSLPRLDLCANLVGTFATEHVKTGYRPDDRKRLSPTVAATYRLFRDEAMHLRVMYKSTFRMPTFNDLYYLRMGNAGLRPEKAHEYSVGLTWGGLKVGKAHLNTTVDAYYNDVDDKIVAFPSTYVWKMANFGNVSIHGVDVTASADIPLARQVELLLSGAYTYQKSVDKTEGSASYNRQLPYTPQHAANASLVVRTPWVDLGYSVLTQGKRWSSAQNTPEYLIKAYWEHTLTLSHLFTFRHCRLNVTGKVQNLTDEGYEIIKYYPMPGRSWNLGATLYL